MIMCLLKLPFKLLSTIISFVGLLVILGFLYRLIIT